ncbi:hypothetical protein [Agrobacterium tumefaciens]|uniref:hypothetical protein n=1 Tax=Agrobacterium tumefaciens TaxID=358 RepID=UPI003BA1E3B8
MSKMRARAHELDAEVKEKTAQIVTLIEERSAAIIDQREFSRHSEIAQLEYDILAIHAAITKAYELAEAEEASR